jgi:two-component system NtrC family sensor kinase
MSTAALRCVIFCVDDELAVLDALRRDLQSIVAGAPIEVEACADAAELHQRISDLPRTDTLVPVIIADQVLPGTVGTELFIALHEQPAFRPTRKVLLSARSRIEDVSKALNRGALHRHLNKPWQFEDLRDTVRDLLTEYLTEQAPEQIESFRTVLSVGTLSHKFVEAEVSQQDLKSELREARRSFLAGLDLSDVEVEEAMIADIDEALGNPPRKRYAQESILLRQDEPAQGVQILVSGVVDLYRNTMDRDVPFHYLSAGRIIGLLALARQGKAFFSCRAVTDVEVIPLTLEQLDEALQRSPHLSVHFVTALLRTLAKRNRGLADLKAEFENLNVCLAADRDRLAETLRQLESAQTALVQSEKMATLGQLCAGIAHELNNPVAALQRATDFVAEDMLSLAAGMPDGLRLQTIMHAALSATPLSTRKQRECRQTLAKHLGDERLARRLVQVGITDIDAYQDWFGKLSRDEHSRVLERMERYYQLGTSLRNISTCSDSIAGLVRSLRAYVRNDETPADEVDIHEGIEDTLRLFNHALRGIPLERWYGDLPRIQAHPGELNQVWTNLISNALHALETAPVRPRITIETDVPDDDHVRVRILDTGSGIAPEHLPHVFDLHFTTKSGRVQFGLGMGLSICQQIVTRHGGTIDVESQPGNTCFTVTLPTRYPHQGGGWL